MPVSVSSNRDRLVSSRTATAVASWSISRTLERVSLGSTRSSARALVCSVNSTIGWDMRRASQAATASPISPTTMETRITELR